MSVTLHTTKGDVKLELHCELVPRSAANFLALCASGAYVGTAFHRVIPSFIVQAGAPASASNKRAKTSRAAFARRLPDEPHPRLTFRRPGVVAFANSGKPSPTGVGSQFFITLVAAPHLDATCTVIGAVIHGMDAVHAVAAGPLDDANAPVDPVVVQRVTVHANPFADGRLTFTLD